MPSAVSTPVEVTRPKRAPPARGSGRRLVSSTERADKSAKVMCDRDELARSGTTATCQAAAHVLAGVPSSVCSKPPLSSALPGAAHAACTSAKGAGGGVKRGGPTAAGVWAPQGP